MWSSLGAAVPKFSPVVKFHSHYFLLRCCLGPQSLMSFHFLDVRLVFFFRILSLTAHVVNVFLVKNLVMYNIWFIACSVQNGSILNLNFNPQKG